MKIEEIKAREILDSRGNPTVATSCLLTDGSYATASVPSGASTGGDEAVELRDNDKGRFFGMGVLSAVSSVNDKISSVIEGMDAKDQKKIDKTLCELDSSLGKENLGANAILSVSIAVAKSQAISDELELFEYLSVKYKKIHGGKYTLPTPMFNILNGGKHAKNNVDIQETMVVPTMKKTFAEKLRAGSEVYQTLKNQLVSEGLSVGLGDEGGFAPDLRTNEDTFKEIERAISRAGYSKKGVRIAVDMAADSIYNKKTKTYHFKGEGRDLDSGRMTKLLKSWAEKYSLLSVEDGLYEKDPHWAELTKTLKPTLSIGDDLLTTNPEKIKEAANKKLAHGVIIKPNQIGTLTETLEAVRIAQKNKFKVIVSHRSGDTNDSFIADLAVAVGADFIKSGAPARSERLAKYNRLLEIEEIINERS
ncbi:MAG: phosphopyruvate hydratase [Patescibacteria group bacterium]|nr:phosphopyruvate hydratase [Patescibacteria group bacterium]